MIRARSSGSERPATVSTVLPFVMGGFARAGETTAASKRAIKRGQATIPITALRTTPTEATRQQRSGVTGSHGLDCGRRSAPEMPHQIVEGLVRGLLGDVVAGIYRAAPGIGRVPALPNRQHVAVDALGVAPRAPDHQQRHRDLASGFEIGGVHLEVAGRAGAVIGARALDRLPVEAADIFLERKGIEKAEADPRLRQLLFHELA